VHDLLLYDLGVLVVLRGQRTECSAGKLCFELLDGDAKGLRGSPRDDSLRAVPRP
jgi:hypothetical protein